MTSESEAPKWAPIREDFFATPVWPPEQVHLRGLRCRSCGEIFLGKNVGCQNCQGTDMEDVALSRRGKLYSYTIIRNRPPGSYKGPDNPFIPFAVGFVELPEGIRILSPLTGCDIEDVKVGMELELTVEKLYDDDEGNQVMAYKFKPC